MAAEKLSLIKKKMGGVSLTSISMIRDCRGEACKIYSMCPYNKWGQCEFRKKNILKAISFYMGALPDGDEHMGRTIGLLLVPAWDDYLRTMIESQALESMTVGDVKTGVIKAHPIFAMKERFMKQIIALENQLKLPRAGMDPNEPDSGQGDDELGDESKLIDGDPEYYEMMSEGIERSGDQDKFDEEDI